MRSKKRYDLHSHSTCSDGSMTPTELTTHAREVGLAGFSITDHDTIEAYKEACPIALELNLELISGVEFSSHYKESSIHILAYAFSLQNEEIINFCKKHRVRRNERNLAIIEKLNKHNIFIDDKDLVINEKVAPICVGRPHIAQAMVKKGYVSSIQDAFIRYIGEGCPCFEAGFRFSIEETLELIKRGGGKSVIAHPHLIHDAKVVDALTQLPFDGIEVYYARFSENQVQKWLHIAKKRDFLVTGGSDFHGFAKQHIHLGCSTTPEESFRILKQHYELQSAS